MRELLVTQHTDTTTDELRARLVTDGYLYLPGFLDPAEVMAVQTELRPALHRAGWLAGPADLTVARSGLRFSADSFAVLYPVVQRVESFHRLAHHPSLSSLARSLLEGPVFCHPAKVVRLAPPTADARTYATRAHQDFVVQHVVTDVLTMWIPLAECTLERQGLRIIPRSHRHGYLPTDPAQGGARPLYLDVSPDDPRWATAEYRLGDVVLFHGLTVHGGGPNSTTSLRISADIRYQRTDEPMLAEFAHPHGWPRTPDWPELTQGWNSRTWYELPDEVDLVPLPANLSYEEVLTRLRAPHSRLLGPPFPGPHPLATRKDPASS